MTSDTSLETVDLGAVPAAAAGWPARALAAGWSWSRRLIAPTVVFALVLGCWYAASYLGLNADQRFLLPPPHRVAAVGFLDWGNLSELLAALFRTAKVAALGLVGAAAVGVGAGVLMDQARWLEQALMPWAILLQTMPIFALAPLFGLRSADPQLHELFTLHGVSRWVRLRRLQLPSALPAILTGLRTSAGACVIGAVVGDLFFTSGPPGLGILVQLYLQRLATEQMFAAAILAAAFGVAVFAAFGALARHTAGRWHPGAAAGGRRT